MISQWYLLYPILLGLQVALLFGVDLREAQHRVINWERLREGRSLPDGKEGTDAH